MEWTPEYEFAQKVDPGKYHSPTAPAGTQPCNLVITSLIVGSHDCRSLQLFPKMYYSVSPALTLSLRSETMLPLENTQHIC